MASTKLEGCFDNGVNNQEALAGQQDQQGSDTPSSGSGNSHGGHTEGKGSHHFTPDYPMPDVDYYTDTSPNREEYDLSGKKDTPPHTLIDTTETGSELGQGH
ncbi:hypothetical protein [Leptolyngbya ohadii]|uniref:hypothetical protein n=1 Tax=Leptolyngbya ohadii TaxID=1962290 RepID=UPI001179E8B0|nr:hypothetical protein [Leptolyngbya ohadii]